ncbi:hypothetical protein BKA80DRAFT_309430 [Phyllosticta citrichinensis]
MVALAHEAIALTDYNVDHAESTPISSSHDSAEDPSDDGLGTDSEDSDNELNEYSDDDEVDDSDNGPSTIDDSTHDVDGTLNKADGGDDDDSEILNDELHLGSSHSILQPD